LTIRLTSDGNEEEENSMTEKREDLNPILGAVLQGQYWIWPKLYCLNHRLLALSRVGASREGRIGLRAPKGTMDCILSLQPIGSESLPAPSKGVKGPKVGPKSNPYSCIVNRGLPKPRIQMRQGNGASIVVRPINRRIYREGKQMNESQRVSEVR
jgi:hypothetical protein